MPEVPIPFDAPRVLSDPERLNVGSGPLKDFLDALDIEASRFYRQVWLTLRPANSNRRLP